MSKVDTEGRSDARMVKEYEKESGKVATLSALQRWYSWDYVRAANAIEAALARTETPKPKAEETLKACPFCGAEAVIDSVTLNTLESKTEGQVQASCSNGCMFMDACSTKAEASIAWNRRSPAKDEGEEITNIEWQAIMDALDFTDTECAVVSDAHAKGKEKVERLLKGEGDVEGEVTVNGVLRMSATKHPDGSISVKPAAPADEGEKSETVDVCACGREDCPDCRGKTIAILQAALADAELTLQSYRNCTKILKAKLKSAEAVVEVARDLLRWGGPEFARNLNAALSAHDKDKQ